MKLGAFELNEPVPELREPHAIAMLQPWIDVGGVGSLTISWLEDHFKAGELARLARPGNFFDFTRYRPTVYTAAGQRQVSVPNAVVSFCHRKEGNDFLFLRLLEPHNHSEVYVESVLKLMARFHVKKYCLIGSMYDVVPHTRPLLVTGGATGGNAQAILDRLGIDTSDYQGPTTINYLVSLRAPEMGIETTGLIVHLPQYTELEEDYMGAVRLMTLLSSIYNIPVHQGYIEKARQQLEQVNVALEKNPQVRAIVQQLEDHYETRLKQKRTEKDSQLSPEVEKFLNEVEKRMRDN